MRARSAPCERGRTCARSRPTRCSPYGPRVCGGGARQCCHRRARALEQRHRRHGSHRRHARHGRRSDARRAREPLPRRRQQLVRSIRPAQRAGRPERPRDPGHGGHRRRQRHGHGARRPVHRRPRLQRLRRQHRQCRPPRVPVAARPRREPGDPRRAERRQRLLGRTTRGLRPRIRAGSPGAPSSADPARLRSRQRWPGGILRHVARESPGGVRRRSLGVGDDDRAVLKRRALALRQRPVSGTRGGRDGRPHDRSVRPHGDRPRGDLVRGAARRRRTRTPAPGRPPADLGGSGERAHAERARPRSTRARLDLRRRLAGRRRRRAAALSDARLQRARALGSPSSGAQFTVHAVDAGSTIAAGEVWADVDPGVGAGQPMAAADGSFDAASEDLVATVPGLAPGDHTMGFRARDAAGNWSSASLLVVSVPSPPARACATELEHPGRGVVAGRDAVGRAAGGRDPATRARRPRGRCERWLRGRPPLVAPSRRLRACPSRRCHHRPARAARERRRRRAGLRSAPLAATCRPRPARLRPTPARARHGRRLDRACGDRRSRRHPRRPPSSCARPARARFSCA